MLANNFFLTLNTGVAAGIGYMLVRSRDSTSIQLACLSCLAAFSVCLIWILLLKSYRDLNAVKFRIIGELETRLPASPFWGAEWRALEQGKNESKYWPLSHLEMGIPWIVAVFYVVLGSLCVHLMVNTQPGDPDSGVPVPPSGIPAVPAAIEGGSMPK